MQSCSRIMLGRGFSRLTPFLCVQRLQVHRFGCSIRTAHGQADLGGISGKRLAFAETMERRMRALFALLLVGILLAGYVWLVEPSAPWPQPSEDATQTQADGRSRQGSLGLAALNENRPATNEQEGKSLRAIAADPQVGPIGSDGGRAYAKEMPAGLTADHQTVGLAQPKKTVKSRSRASTAPFEADRLTHPELGTRITNEHESAGEKGQLRKARRGLHGRRYIHRQYPAPQRFSELINHPLDIRCVACIMFHP